MTDIFAALAIVRTLATALIVGLVSTLAICRLGKRNNADYDWRVLWLSVSIIVLVVEVVFRTLKKF